MATKGYPPLAPGTFVRTTEPNLEMRGQWTEEGWAKRIWNIYGPITAHHDSHGLCYDVKHPDGSVGCYDPSELEVVDLPPLPWQLGVHPRGMGRFSYAILDQLAAVVVETGDSRETAEFIIHAVNSISSQQQPE